MSLSAPRADWERQGATRSRRPSSVGSDRLEIQVVSQWTDFLQMERDWTRLWEQSPQRNNPFLTHSWFRAWWEAFGSGKQLRILRLTSGDRLIGIVPLMLQRSSYYGLPMRLLSLITNDHTNRAEMILAERAEECVRRVLEFIRSRTRDWDMAELNFLPAGSPTAETVRSQAAQFELVCGTKPSYDSPFIPLDGDWESFYRGRRGHFRRNMKNREKRLSRSGRIDYEECSGSLDRFLEETFAVGDRSWKGVKSNTAVASTPALRRFYTRLAELTHREGRLSLHLLRVGGKPIAFHYSLRKDGVVYLLKTEYDMAYRPYSPGHQIQKHVLQSCYTHGLREFDFLGPDMPWKREWADRVRPHVRLLLFHPGRRSRMLRLLELRAKPALKRLRFARRPPGTDTATSEES